MDYKNTKMKNITVIIFFLIQLNSFAQTCRLNEFYSNLYYNKIFNEFFIKNAPSFEIGNNEADISKADTTPINKFSVFKFVKHPQLDSSSLGGRLEIFSSVCSDGSCVYEVYQKIFISFSSIDEATIYLNHLLSGLRSKKIKEISYLEDGIKIHKLIGKTEKGKTCQIFFKLIPSKETFDLYIGDF